MAPVVVLVLIVLVAAVSAWATGVVGRRVTLTPLEARDALTGLLDEISPQPPLVVPAGLLEADTIVGGPPSAATHGTDDSGAGGRGVTWIDGAVPAGIAATMGLYEWLTPDSAALAAMQHVTGEEVNSALDFHAIVAGKALSGEGYHFLSDASMSNWMGHVGEQQIREQVVSWAGDSSVSMPGSASFEGADATIFGDDFQVKFYEDFNDIVNQHGDTLIVNEDALNIPDDALRIDFSEPFDPAILEGHDVIIAEGLTQAGAIDSWESAAGVWAGGLDAGDMAGEVFDAAIPGIGAAFAVAMQGYRRRKALGDETLRAEASKRIARDSAERLGAVSAGAGAGALAGMGVDILTLGMTGGLGTLAGSVIGSWVAGRQAAKVASARDADKIKAAQKRVMASTAAYGLAVEKAQSDAESAWQETLDRDEQVSAAIAKRLDHEAEVILGEARANLDDALTIDSNTADDLLEQSRTAVRDLSQAGWGLPALRERHAWLARMSELGPAATTNDVLVAVVAAPGGRDRVRAWLQAANERRQVIVAAVDTSMRSLFRNALEARTRLRQHLVDSREQLTQDVHGALAMPIKAVESANSQLHRELVLAGKAT